MYEIRDQFNSVKPKEKDLDQTYKQVINKTYLLGIVNYSSVLVANHSKRRSFFESSLFLIISNRSCIIPNFEQFERKKFSLKILRKL